MLVVLFPFRLVLQVGGEVLQKKKGHPTLSHSSLIEKLDPVPVSIIPVTVKIEIFRGEHLFQCLELWL